MKVNEDLDTLLPKCDMELVLLDRWSFGEVHKIRKPHLTTTTTMTMDVITENVVASGTKMPVITGNVQHTVPCSVSVKRITSSRTTPSKSLLGRSGYDMHNHPPPRKVTQRTSGRKCTKVDYSQYELADDPPTPPKQKRMMDLKRKPSANRIAAEKYRTKPANTPQLIMKPLSVRVLVTTSGDTSTQQSAVASTSRTITTPATK